MKRLLFLLIILFSLGLFSQPTIEWKKCYGGSSIDRARSIQQTTDGGYIVVGESKSSDEDVTGSHGYFDAWVVKLNASGGIMWKKCLGGGSDDFAYAVQQTTDGGYIIVGSAKSTNGDISNHHDGNGSSENYDYWVIKLNSSGDILWSRCYGGSNDDEAQSVCQTADGGYIIVGNSASTDDDVTGNHGYFDAWILKLNASGDTMWTKCYGGGNNDWAYSVKQTTDGGYIVAGCTDADDSNSTGTHGTFDAWALKLNASGDTIWTKCLGGSNYDYAYSIQQTTDKGYILAGITQSLDGDVSNLHGDDKYDYWIVKLDTIGDTIWTKCLGGSKDDYAYSIQQTADGGYIVAGGVVSSDGDVSGKHGQYDEEDYWIVRLDSMGNIEWKKCLGGTELDIATSVKQTTDGGYIIAGFSSSYDDDVTGNSYGSVIYWIVKLSKNAAIETMPFSLGTLSLYPNPMDNYTEIEIPNHESTKQIMVKIIDFNGKTIQEWSTTNQSKIRIENKNFKSGIYQVVISTDKRIYTGKLIVK